MYTQYTQEDLNHLGVVNPTRLRSLATTRQKYLIKDFVLKPSINILVGDSGLGKSALAAQIGMCVAAGKDFFGHQVTEPGLILYCDAEAQPSTMEPMLNALAHHIGLDEVPETFCMWNPNWNIDNKDVVITQNKVQMYHIVDKLKPKLVIVDSLRNYFPLAIKEQDQAGNMIKEMRRHSGQSECSWLLIHHLRKKNKEEKLQGERTTIKQDVHLWLEEAAGSFALINNTDLRLGWEKDLSASSEALWLGGFLRVVGVTGPYKVIRDLDNEGEPVGYRLAQPSEQLNETDYDIYQGLPNGEFTYDYLTKQLGKSQASAARFVKRATDLKFIITTRSIPNTNGGRPRKVYLRNEQPK